ncbi:TetR family transcriptional regulator [Herbihabitans rhizosphaerae]|uniref:TetR family transcriptional regulator n=2 Tax=Herbihabitans rhizosphaerae TaxID=1872711 RepID=A0A4Q7L908_9PSEU|nr:TetR family transcriptional regulator [Herbihabitans rhizosphaerae]
MLTFWEHGYDATSIADLTGAMGIRAPSMYAAFGDKMRLFAEVVDVYQRTHGVFAKGALDEEPTVRAGVARMLAEAAVAYTERGHPRGCLVISAGINCTEASADVETMLRDIRNANVTAIRKRIQSDIRRGALPPETDAKALARYTGAVLQGMSQQARDGASKSELLAVAEMAMHCWPSA